MTTRFPALAAIAALALPISLTSVAVGQESPFTGRLEITVVDGATGVPTAFRARLTTERGERVAAPEQATALMYGTQDEAEGYELQPDGSFYVGGAFSQALPAGRYRLSITKGYEYLGQEHLLEVPANEALSRTIRLERWIDMPSRGWYSVDDHIHLRRSPRENPLILTWLAAEDVHVGALLQMGDIHATYYAQYAWGRDGVYQVGDRFIASGQEEPRTHEIGHTISLGADEFVRATRQYYHFDTTFDRVHELGGLTGYAHQGVLFDGYRGLTLDVLRGKVDFMEVLQFCGDVQPLEVQHYYHFLDLGFRLTATAGSDFPWCGTDSGPQIGNARFYTYLEGPLEFDAWKEAVRGGHTFVSSGPVIELTVDGAIPGDELRVEPGSTVTVRARAYGHGEQVPLGELAVVAHGEVVGRALPGEATGQDHGTLTVEMELTIDRGVWIAARAGAGPNQFAHTTPVYVTTGAGFHNPSTVRRRLDDSERYLTEIEAEIAAGLADPLRQPDRVAWRFACPRERSGCLSEGLTERIAETRAVIARLRETYAAQALSPE